MRPQRETIAERRQRRAEIDDPEVVLAAAARLLEVRARSVGEVRRRLTQTGYRSDLVDGAIGRLVDLGVLDDEAFARAWVESRDRARPRGEVALRRELRIKGVSGADIDVALANRQETSDPESSADETAARRLLERRRPALDRILDLRARRQRAYALLARNGFDPGTCASVASAWVGREEADAEGDEGST